MAHSGTMKLSARDWFQRGSQAVSVEPRTPQARFPLHNHEFGEVVIVMSGNGWHLWNDEPQLITSGEVLYIRPEDRHAFEEVHDLYLTNFIYRPSDRLLRPDRIHELLENPGSNQRWQLTEHSVRQLRPLIAELSREAHSDGPHSDVMAECLFIQLAVALWRLRIPIACDELENPGHFGNVLAYLRRHCTEEVNVEEVALRSGFSLRTFTRMFRAATSTTPHKYLVELRIGRAMQEIRANQHSITEVAFASGFNDSNYFSSCFKKRTGVSPSEYRRHAQRSRSPMVEAGSAGAQAPRR